MSIPKISGRKARRLLDEDTAGLSALAPELATTVVWLYERIAEIHNDQRCWADAYRAPHLTDPDGKDPARLARAEAHDDCADMLQTLLDDEEARP